MFSDQYDMIRIITCSTSCLPCRTGITAVSIFYECNMSKRRRKQQGCAPIYCENPFCPQDGKAYTSMSAFTQHIGRSASCEQYVHGHLNLRSITRENATSSTVVTNTKKPSVLRRDMVNNIPPLPDDEEDLGFADTDAHSFPCDDEDAIFDNESNCLDVPTFAFRPPQEGAVLSSSGFMYTTQQKWTVALLKLLDDINAPDYAFRLIIEWALSAKDDGYSFQPPGGVTRNANVDILFKSVPNAPLLRPSIQPVRRLDGSSSNVIVFDFVPQLLRLLQNPSVMKPENLAINFNAPLLRYESPGNVLGEALSGSVYRTAYQRFISDPSRQLFVPIIQWIDRTSVTGNDRFSLKPYMFTPAIFTESFRRTFKAWGYHGFLPKSKKSSAQNQTKKQGVNIGNYHAELRVVLNTFRSANNRLRNITLPIGPNGSITVDIVTCILFVIQDMQEGDMLCGRYGPHTPLIKRHCRSCDVSYDDLDNPEVNCTFLLSRNMDFIAQSEDKELRSRWSQHKLDNAFNHMPLADPVRGIFGATPVETMHAYRKGMIEMVTFLVLDNVPASKKALLDDLALKFHKSHRQTWRGEYPATDFTNGITNLTKISASERLGLVFLFVILAQYHEGWQILESALKQRTDTSLTDVVELLEAMLCFDAWLNRDTFWNLEDAETAKESAQFSIKVLMEMCSNYLPTTKSNRWNFPKFHELLHIVDDMSRFGAPTNYCAQRPESLLIAAAKQPGRRAQKRHQGIDYELQAAQRLAASGIIETVYERIFDTPSLLSHENITPPSTNSNPTQDNKETAQSPISSISQSTDLATTCTIHLEPSTTEPGNVTYRQCWSSTTKVEHLTLPTPLLIFLCEKFGPRVHICTQYKRDAFTFRCHPAFQSGNAIYDWMLVKFETKADGNQEAGVDYFPCKLVAVVFNKDAVVPNDDDKYRLVVQCTLNRTGVKSVLLTEWWWSPEYVIISPAAIFNPCFVITIKEDQSIVMETLAYEKWPGEFTNTKY